MASPLSQALSHRQISHLPLVSPCLTRLWACVYIITPTTTSELLVLSLLESEGFPIPPPAPPAATPHSARGPLSRLSPLLPLPHLCFAPTIPKLLSVSHSPQLTRSLSHCHIPTRPVWLITPVPSGLPTCQRVPQTQVGPVAGPWRSECIHHPENPGGGGVGAGQPLCSRSSLTFSQMEDTL